MSALDVLADYMVPVSIDHAGRYPSKRPGAVWFEELNGRRFRMELVGQPRDKRAGYDPSWGSTVLCDCHVSEVRAEAMGKAMIECAEHYYAAILRAGGDA